ncbi:PREDICTED: homeobox protein MSH-D [Cyphomyrmex costatus]|uniref:homeobox protein MSH-D n=1 Tax=Cyphomyrmex costatus TaxID=456900 RepID=UPI00085223CD|nr:PREDICTED: homeobox protein MSH-D [Cyphomyrmex costatus]
MRCNYAFNLDLPAKRMRFAKKKKEEEEEGYVPQRGPSVCVWPLERTPKYVCMYIYIAKGSSFGGFSETLGMTSEARGSWTSRNTDFSIARILAEELPGADVDARKQHVSPECESRGGTKAEDRTSERASEPKKRDASRDGITEQRRSGDRVGESTTRWTDLTWLQYTRYRPPRLPRRSLTEKRIKRQAGDHPRIPFSSSQLQVLEEKYKEGAYLSRTDVIEMSATLRLPQNKIKIWFQNRRARQKRESLNSTITTR